MRVLAWWALVAACLSCEQPRSDVSPLADAPASDDSIVTAAPSTSQAAPGDTPAVERDVGDTPWPSAPAPAVKAIYAGSWEPREPLGFDQTWFDEAALLALPDSRLAGRRQWRGITSQGDRMLVDAQIRDRTGPAIAYTWFLLTWNELVGTPETDLPAVIHFRHRGRVRLWFDGELIIDEEPAADGAWHTLHRSVKLNGSDDVFLVKVARGGPELGPSANYELCVSTPDGDAFPGQIWQTVRVW